MQRPTIIFRFPHVLARALIARRHSSAGVGISNTSKYQLTDLVNRKFQKFWSYVTDCPSPLFPSRFQWRHVYIRPRERANYLAVAFAHDGLISVTSASISTILCWRLLHLPWQDSTHPSYPTGQSRKCRPHGQGNAAHGGEAGPGTLAPSSVPDFTSKTLTSHAMVLTRCPSFHSPGSSIKTQFILLRAPLKQTSAASMDGDESDISR